MQIGKLVSEGSLGGSPKDGSPQVVECEAFVVKEATGGEDDSPLRPHQHGPQAGSDLRTDDHLRIVADQPDHLVLDEDLGPHLSGERQQ